MKLLFICEKIDLYLKQRLDELTENGIEADCLVMPKFTLYKNWEKEVFTPDDRFDFLGKGALKKLVKSLKYKKLFDSLEQYDSVNIYKSSKLCAPYLENIKKISKSYFITVENEPIEHTRSIKKLFDLSHCILFDSQSALESFEKEFGYDEKTLIARDGNHLFSLIDDLKESEIEKFKNYLNLSDDKHIVYCDLGSNIEIQKAFIDEIIELPYELLTETTFIFDPAASTLIDKEMLIEYLEDKRFDYLLPDSMLSDVQKAMLFKISQSTILLSGSNDYGTIQPSLYVKNHLYLYAETKVEEKYKKLDIFIDSCKNFENIVTFNKESYSLTDELKQKNREIITKLYHPNISLENYMKILEIL